MRRAPPEIGDRYMRRSCRRKCVIDGNLEGEKSDQPAGGQVRIGSAVMKLRPLQEAQCQSCFHIFLFFHPRVALIRFCGFFFFHQTTCM